MSESPAAPLGVVPIWKDLNPRATPLGGGITNQIFRVDTDEHSHVLRVLSKSTDHLGIDRDHELACTRVAAELGISPPVDYSSLEDGVIVVRYVDAKPVSAEAAREREMMARIVDVVKRFHEGPEIPGSFCPFETVRSYHGLAAERGIPFPESLPRALSLMERIETAVARVRVSAPCHNDLLAANFLVDGEKIWLIDWEYGGMGDPYFDLGNFSVNQELDTAGAAHLIECYSGEVTPARVAHLRLMELASDLRESFWGFLQSGISKIDFDYTSYAGKHLDRFLSRASTPELETWIDELS